MVFYKLFPYSGGFLKETIKMAGTGGGKTDMERIGLFSEVGYTTIGDKYPKVHVSSCKYKCLIPSLVNSFQGFVIKSRANTKQP